MSNEDGFIFIDKYRHRQTGGKKGGREKEGGGTHIGRPWYILSELNLNLKIRLKITA